MNKGFAVLTKLFAQDGLSAPTCVFVDLLAILVWLWSPKFAHVAIGSDPTVTPKKRNHTHTPKISKSSASRLSI